MSQSLHELIAKSSPNYSKLTKLLSTDKKEINSGLKKNTVALKQAGIEIGYTPLFIAIKMRDKKLIKILVENGADFNLPLIEGDFKGMTPFAYMLCDSQYFDDDYIASLLAVQNLVQLNQVSYFPMQVNAENSNFVVSYCTTPLGVACALNRRGLATVLIEKGADINSPSSADDWQISIVGIAAELGRKELLKLFLSNSSVQTNQIFNRDGYEATPLTLVITSQLITNEQLRIEIVDLLLEKGANPSIALKGTTVLFDACRIDRPSLQIIRMLITKDPLLVNQIVSGGLSAGYSPLLFSCSRGLIELVEFLIKNNADVNYIRPLINPDSFAERSNTPLFTAVYLQNLPLFIKLLIYKADIYYIRDTEGPGQGESALSIACSLGLERFCQILLQKMGSTDHQNKQAISRHAVYIAIKYQKKSILSELLNSKIPIDINTGASKKIYGREGGITPLCAAIIWIEDDNLCKDFIQLLINYGADINQPDEGGRLPLMAAIEGKRGNIFLYLLELGARLDLFIQEYGASPLERLYTYDNGLINDIVKYEPNFFQRSIFKDSKFFLKALAAENITLLNLLEDSYVSLPVELNNIEMNPLHLAIQLISLDLVSMELVKCLLSKGADVHKLEESSGLTPLQLAVDLNQLEVAELLIAKSANCLEPIIEGELKGLSVLEIAIIRCDHLRMPDTLLMILGSLFGHERKKKFAELLINQKLFSLFSAILLQDIEVIKLLMQCRINMEIKLLGGKYKGETILAAAALSGNKEIIELFTPYQFDWHAIVDSERGQSRCIIDIVKEFMPDIEEKISKPKKLEKSSKADEYKPSNRIDKQKPTKINIGRLVYDSLVKNDVKKDHFYLLKHAYSYLLLIKKLINSNEFPNIEIKMQNLRYYLLRFFEAVYAYMRDTKDEFILTKQLAGDVRDFLMHGYFNLSLSKLEFLARSALEINIPLKNKMEDFFKEQQLVLTTSMKLNIPENKAITLNITQWYTDNCKAIERTINDYLQGLHNNFSKIYALWESFQDKTIIYNDKEIFITLQSLIVNIGEIYQQLHKRNLLAQIEINANALEVLKDCRFIRDITGHEFSDSFEDKGLKYRSLDQTNLQYQEIKPDYLVSVVGACIEVKDTPIKLKSEITTGEEIISFSPLNSIN